MSVSLLLRLIFWPWLAAAFYVGHTLLLQRIPPAAIPAIVLLLTTLVVMIYLRLKIIRHWIDGLDLRRLVFLHLTRFVGIAFLVLHHRGELPYAFAVPAGVGDIVIATLALPVIFAPLRDSTRLRAISLWNIAGLADLLLVVFTAARINLTQPASLRPLTELPLSFLPTVLVPLLIGTHVIIFLRLSRSTNPA